MSSLSKLGYFLFGIGVGVFASSFVLEREFCKPIGEVEEFIPEEIHDISEDSDHVQETSTNGTKNSVENGKSSESISTRENRRNAGRIAAGYSSNSGEANHQEFGADQTEILHYYANNEGHIRRPNQTGSKRPSKRRQEFDKMREEENHNLTTRYSKMYGTDGEYSDDKEMTDILHEVSSKTDSRESYAVYDVPSDDDVDEYPEGIVDIHDIFTLERVEPNFEVYLDDNPQDFVTLIYYNGDSTLCDDGEQIIPNPEDVVGMVALQRLVEGGPGADSGIIFVHNIRTCVNYEVVLDMGSYSETVLGIFDERHSRLHKGGVGDGSS